MALLHKAIGWQNKPTINSLQEQTLSRANLTKFLEHYKMAKYYIQRKGDGYLETVDCFNTRKEANSARYEYVMSDNSGVYYISSRPCKGWYKNLDEIILSYIDLSNYPEGATLASVLESEKGKNGRVDVKAVEDWLRGLASACEIPYWDNGIKELLEDCGKFKWSIDNYWAYAARVVFNHAYK